MYGGGGNSGAQFSHDFVELFNAGDTPADLSGLTLRYTSNAGSFPNSGTNYFELPADSIPAGGYYLVQMAVGTNTSLPALPTIEEAGVPGYEGTTWFTIAVAGSVPPATVEQLNAEVRKVLVEPAVIERFKALGAVIVGNSVADAKAFFVSETAKWNNVIETAHIKID